MLLLTVSDTFIYLLLTWRTKAEVRIFSDIIEALKSENNIVLSEQRRTISYHRSSFPYCKLFEVLIWDYQTVVFDYYFSLMYLIGTISLCIFNKRIPFTVVL
jgi:hypothetical protein